MYEIWKSRTKNNPCSGTGQRFQTRTVRAISWRLSDSLFQLETKYYLKVRLCALLFTREEKSFQAGNRQTLSPVSAPAFFNSLQTTSEVENAGVAEEPRADLAASGTVDKKSKKLFVEYKYVHVLDYLVANFIIFRFDFLNLPNGCKKFKVTVISGRYWIYGCGKTLGTWACHSAHHLRIMSPLLQAMVLTPVLRENL